MLARIRNELSIPERERYFRWTSPEGIAAAATVAFAFVLLLVFRFGLSDLAGLPVRDPSTPRSRVADSGAINSATSPLRSTTQVEAQTSNDEAVRGREPYEPSAPVAQAETAQLPDIVLERPELFRDYRMFERLEAMENFETVQSLPFLDVEETVPSG